MHTFLITVSRLLMFCSVSAAAWGPQSQTAVMPTRPSYIIGVGDVLRVTVYSGGTLQPDFANKEYTVQTDGAVTLPLIKPIKLDRLTVSAAMAAVRKALIDGSFFSDACTVDIIVTDYHSQVVKVQGAVRNPGNIPIKANQMNISDALVQAGNLAQNAGTVIRVKRANPNRPVDADVKIVDGWEQYTTKQLNDGDLTDVLLDNGDTIDVPVAPVYFISGFVQNVGTQQWEPNLTLQRAIFKAGGATKDGAVNRTKVMRVDPKTGKQEEVDLGKDPLLFIIQPNDVIDVPKKRMGPLPASRPQPR